MPVICTANQLTGFYMRATLVFNGLTACCFWFPHGYIQIDAVNSNSQRKQRQALREKCPNTESFQVRIFLCSDWIQENTDQKKLRIWPLFTQCLPLLSQPYLKISYFPLSSQESSLLDQPLQFLLSESAFRDEAGLF